MDINDVSSAHLESIAHIVRRTSFGPRPGTVESLAPLTVEEVLDEAIAATDDVAVGTDPPDLDGDGPGLEAWWFDRMRDPAAGLHERMVWYWHAHFTTSLAVVEPTMMWRQHELVRTHALGDFRTLTRAMLHDAAMLVYLDGDGSRGDDPNENLSRELMELFTLGVGAFHEDDVKAGARALSGYHVDWDSGEVWFEPEDHYDRPVRFLGRRGRFDADTVADMVCDHPACADHVSSRIFRYLVGRTPADTEIETLASVFRAADLAILPLVDAILRSDAFLDARRSRARQPVEWLLAATAALGVDDVELDPWAHGRTGQIPFHPPNVAGWPDDDRWLGGDQVLHRVQELLELGWDERIDVDVEPTVESVLGRCGIYEPSEQTRHTLERAIADQTEFDQGLELLFALTLVSPEFALA